jgi:hypothetical protein
MRETFCQPRIEAVSGPTPVSWGGRVEARQPKVEVKFIVVNSRFGGHVKP